MCSIALLGLGLSIGGSLYSGVQQNQMAQAQAKAIDQQRQAEGQAAAYEMAQERKKQSALEGQARARIGASGVALAGSPTEVLAANAREGELDIAAISYGSQLKQNQLGTQAALTRYSGRQELAGGIIKAVRFGGSYFADPTKNNSGPLGNI